MIFRYKKANFEKLVSNGFIYTKGVYRRSFLILKDQFRLELEIDKDSHIVYQLFEVDTNEEYMLIKVKTATGTFLAEVTIACEDVLSRVAKTCFDTSILQGEQTNRVISYLKKEYQIEPEFLWKNSLNCAFRMNKTKKWMAVMLTVERKKIGLVGDGMIEIINLKDTPEDIEKRLDNDIFFGGYHMNKKHWYTICLNDSLDDEVLFDLIDKSYSLVQKKMS